MALRDSDIAYSNLLHDSAAKWGLAVLPGRPVIGLAPVSDPQDGIIGNPYQPGGMLPIEETLKPPVDLGFLNKIELFRFNGQWGYCLTLHVKEVSVGYGAFLKFCDPYPTRQAAIEAAARDIIHRVKGNKPLTGWAESLLKPQPAAVQPGLF